jgi:aminoacrylate hydrolase
VPIAKLEDCELYYEEFGSGFPVLMVAGLGGIGAYWKPQIEPFAKSYRVIVHDHRGTGSSSKSKIKYSLEQMARDTLGLLDALKIDCAHLLGHSTGGAIGQVLATEHPQRLAKIVMSATWTKADGFLRLCFETRRTLLLKSGAAAYVAATPIFLYPSWWIRDNIQQLEAHSTVYGVSPDIDVINSRIDALLRFDWSARLGEIKHDVLIMGARNDHLTPAYFSEELAERIPGARLVIMDDGGHAASQTLPDEFNRHVLAFLKD